MENTVVVVGRCRFNINYNGYMLCRKFHQPLINATFPSLIKVAVSIIFF